MNSPYVTNPIPQHLLPPVPTKEALDKLVAAGIDPFSMALFEYIFDLPKTVTPEVGKILIEMCDRVGAEPALAMIAFPANNITHGQVYGSAFELGSLLAGLAMNEVLTVEEIVRMVGCFPNVIVGFSEHFGMTSSAVDEASPIEFEGPIPTPDTDSIDEDLTVIVMEGINADKTNYPAQ